MNLYIIDAIGPFFRDYDKDIINWSKIPFDNLESGGQVNKVKLSLIRRDFSMFIKRVVRMGYNAISIDDVAHLADFDFYPSKLRHKINQYRNEYRELFKIAKEHNLRIFVNTDIMFYNESIRTITGNRHSRIINLLYRAFRQVLTDFPVDGIIVRIGEEDGTDVKGDFLSKLTIKTTRQARIYIQRLLPLFKKLDKYLIFRTWTVGAYKIGDLMWNSRTYDRVFRHIYSDHLIISMKYGDTDFFDGLKLNPLFFRGRHKKIIELQTRREREGSAVNPYYVGWAYEDYARDLEDNKKMVGISVWCQTGGWARWRDITFLENSCVTNELNTYATLRIFKDGMSADSAIESFFGNRDMISFYRKYNEALRDLLYIKGFSDRRLYFRRIRIPPLLWICWDHITITPFMIFAHKELGGGEPSVKHELIDEVLKIGKKLGLEDAEFHYDTLKILDYCRMALSEGLDRDSLIREIVKYRSKYPDIYRFTVDTREYKMGKRLLAFLLKVLIREKPKYRLMDKISTSRALSVLYYFFLYMQKRHLPSLVNKVGMKIDTFFR